MTNNKGWVTRLQNDSNFEAEKNLFYYKGVISKIFVQIIIIYSDHGDKHFGCKDVIENSLIILYQFNLFTTTHFIFTK